MVALVASQATVVCRLGRGLGEAEDFRLVSVRLHVGFARPMAAFASYSLAVVFQGKFGVGIAAQSLHFACMAHDAGFGANKVG